MEDVILPDDFEGETTTSADETPEQTETTDDFTETSETTTSTDESVKDTPQTIRIKFDREEKEIPVEEAAVLAQKGMNYDRAVERAAQEARDAVIANMGWEWQGKAIKTEAEYKQAIAEKELLDKYQDLPDELRTELIENRKFREQYEADRKAQEQTSRNNAELMAFLEYFQSENGRQYDPNKDQIPKEVWEAQAKGVPLKFAYMEHQNKQLSTQLKALKKTEENTQKAPVGSLTAHGSTEPAAEDDFMKGFNSI